MTEKEESEVIQLCESKPYKSTSGRPRNSVLGVAINDAPFITNSLVNGKYQKDPAYSQWKSMVSRCYSEREKAKRSTYEECTLDDRWLSFMSFYRSWKPRYFYSYQIDKDILVTGNKEYSPDKCLMVPIWVNTFIGEKRKTTNLPVGVTWSKNKGRYLAQITTGMKYKTLGYYDDPIEASKVWFNNKINHLNAVKHELDLIDDRLFSCLFFKIESMRWSG